MLCLASVSKADVRHEMDVGGKFLMEPSEARPHPTIAIITSMLWT